MKKLNVLLYLIVLSFLANGQNINIYGFLPVTNPAADYVLLAEMNPLDGTVIQVDSIRPVSGYALGSSAFDSYNQAFTFIGVDPGFVFRLYSRSVVYDTTIWSPPFNETINDLQHDMNTLQTYGLGNYPYSSGAGDYALRFLRIDQATGQITELNRMPEATAYPAGSSTFDANNGRYIVHIIDTNFVSHLYTIQAESGELLSDAVFNLPAGADILNLEYNNRDNKVYGLFRNPGDNFFAVASLDIETASIVDTAYVINDLKYFVQGASVFHQMSQNYILYYIDDLNNSRLLSVDVSLGNLTANPVISDYLTELEVDNFDFAMMAYHGTTSVDEPSPITGDNLMIFPNPADERITLRYKILEKDDPVFTVVDMRGQPVVQKVLHHPDAGSYKMSMDVSHLPAGIYIVQYEHLGRMQSERIVVLD
ncbi:MAG: T9SS type A sorting domain-containing protein [Bacteroidales bacterium]|jgi:hypothetical protein|nr:T9SS type A sorting domain-containing protein [Bacteroidales bacterium]